MASKKTRLSKVSVGTVFSFVNSDGKEENWKVIGRPHKSGEEESGKPSYWVPCSYVLKDKRDQGVGVPTKSFNLNSEVTIVRSGGKDYDAIDSRDQPKGVTPLSKLRAIGDAPKEKDLVDDEAGDLEALITDDEEVSKEE